MLVSGARSRRTKSRDSVWRQGKRCGAVFPGGLNRGSQESRCAAVGSQSTTAEAQTLSDKAARVFFNVFFFVLATCGALQSLVLPCLRLRAVCLAASRGSHSSCLALVTGATPALLSADLIGGSAGECSP